MLYPLCHTSIGVFHTSLPVLMSSATTLASSWPRNNIPSPIATPRLSQPQHTLVSFWSIPDQRSHGISPFLALSANTSVAGADVHDPVFDDRCCLKRVFAAEPGAFEMGDPGALELLDAGRVDLVERGVALVRQIAAVGDPVLADRALQQAVDFRIGSLYRTQQEQAHSRDRCSQRPYGAPHHLPPLFQVVCEPSVIRAQAFCQLFA